jgi:hypothetical protein
MFSPNKKALDKMTPVRVAERILEIRSRFYDQRQSREFISAKCGVPIEYIDDIVFYKRDVTIDSVREVQP